ncbi:alpha/beta fold hydrolase [Azospira restricta]|uniref:Alpha/beta fold hydrolase n=1 Tax=Azospira restricta TaxID=404405 RepID=A0A974SP21_9RHOO|nr:alpha/beta fold hydrolase [Azospira restricta]QRJ63833.1 alpha/beta fold hydrolase [Azospira restricta]
MTTYAPTLSQLNSTIVRSFSMAAQTATRGYFGLLSRLRPELARRQAERLFTTPPRHPAAYPAPAAARRETVLADAGHVVLWQAGPAAAPAVLLVHGWGGVGAQLGGFVAPLLARGFRVVWFDHPGHGESEGRRTALPNLARAITAIDQACGPFHAAIGHSLGAAAIGLALRDGLVLERAVLLGTPASIAGYMHRFARQLGLSAAVRERLRQRIEHRYGKRFDDIDRIEDLGRLSLPALLVHDSGDRHVPFAHSQRIAACLPGAQLIRTHGLGHFRLLRDPAVLRAATAFVAGEAGTLPAELPELPLPAALY